MSTLSHQPALSNPFRGEVYWVADVQTSTNTSYHSRGHGNPESALTDGMAQASYYILECGYEASIAIEVYCDRCLGTGHLATGKRVIRHRRCPDCKGEGSRVLLAFPVAIHENATARHDLIFV